MAGIVLQQMGTMVDGTLEMRSLVCHGQVFLTIATERLGGPMSTLTRAETSQPIQVSLALQNGSVTGSTTYVTFHSAVDEETAELLADVGFSQRVVDRASGDGPFVPLSSLYEGQDDAG